MACAATAGTLTQRDSLALSTTFPFDTTLWVFGADGQTRQHLIARYGDTVFFHNAAQPTLCPSSSASDFAHVRLPLNAGNEPLLRHQVSAVCSSTGYVWNVGNIEYVVQIDSVLLFMRPVAGDSTGIQVTFDTVRRAPLLIGPLPASDTAGMNAPGAQWSTVGIAPVLEWTRQTGGCPCEEYGELRDTSLFFATFDNTHPWPAGSYAAGLFPLLPLANFGVNVHKLPADSSGPLVIRQLNAACQVVSQELRTDGIEYEIPFGPLGSVYLQCTGIVGTALRFQFDTLSWLGGSATTRQGRSHSTVDMSIRLVGRSRLAVVLSGLPLERTTPAVMRVMDLSGRLIILKKLPVPANGPVVVDLPGLTGTVVVSLTLPGVTLRRLIRSAW